MAGLAPFFITGASAKIKLNGKTLAYCTDFSYSVIVNHAQPKVLGMYESVSIEPLSYSVNGSFSVIRYAKNVAGNIKEFGYNTPNGVNPDGNGLGAVAADNIFLRTGAFGNDGRVNEALNPSKLQNATFFDIEIYQKMPDGTTSVGVARVRGCRITRADFSMAKKTPGIERFQFDALYLDEDSFQADMSGIGQQFS